MREVLGFEAEMACDGLGSHNLFLEKPDSKSSMPAQSEQCVAQDTTRRLHRTRLTYTTVDNMKMRRRMRGLD